MNKEQAMKEIVNGEHSRFAFKKALFVDIPDAIPMEDGFFTLHDQDYNARIEDRILYLELWFMEMAIHPPETAILEKGEKESIHGRIPYVKLLIAVAEDDLDYIYKNGERIYL